MRVTVKELRQAIEEVMQEMKLGIAEPNPPGQSFSGRREEPEEPEEKRPFTMRQMLKKITTNAFAPDEEALASDKMYKDMINKTADWSDWSPFAKKRKVREANINEMPYMRPSHMQGIGPDVDREQKDGKISATQAMAMFPQAVEKIIDHFMIGCSPDELEELFGTQTPYPGDVAKEVYEFKLTNGELSAYESFTGGVFHWIAAKNKWDES